MPDAVYRHLCMRGDRGQNTFKKKNDAGGYPVDDGECFCVHGRLSLRIIFVTLRQPKIAILVRQIAK
jgi:hypothetical protein